MEAPEEEIRLLLGRVGTRRDPVRGAQHRVGDRRRPGDRLVHRLVGEIGRGREGRHEVGATARDRDQVAAPAIVAHDRRLPPVFFATAATILADTASISASVSVRSVGWSVTSIATDALSGATFGPW